MKNRFLILILLALLPSAMAMAGKKESRDTISVARAFRELPISSLDLLSPEARQQMLSSYKTDSVVNVLNNLSGLSSLEKLTDNYALVKLTPVSTLQIKVLPMKDGNEIVMTIYTTGNNNDSKDSDIAFYDSRLNPLPKEKYFPLPKLSDFFNVSKGFKTNMKEIADMLPFYTIFFEASPSDNNVKGSLTLGDILTVEDQKLVEMFLRPEVNFLWDGKKFKVQK